MPHLKDSEIEKLELPKLNKDFKKIVDFTKFSNSLKSLKNKECLIIVDNAQELLQNDED